MNSASGTNRVTTEGGRVTRTAIVWFRRDLRLADNSALDEALEVAGAIVPAWVAPADSGKGESAWLAHSVRALDADLRELRSSLIVRDGAAAHALLTLARECGADAVYCTRVWTPAGLAEEREVASALEAEGVRLVVSEGSLLVLPDAIETGTGGPYKVFTPYFRSWEREWTVSEPEDAPRELPVPERPVASGPLPDRRTGGPGPTAWWTPGETGAQARLATFVDEALAMYDEGRDIPAIDGTSRLSPHLAFGEVSPRQIVAAVAGSGLPVEVTRPFVRQLAWREFAAHVLHHHPRTLTEPLRPEFARMPWRDDADALEAWRTGHTGYPLVDAGMRQLAATGWMHNRVRLVVASMLAKHLLVPWQTGERHFADMLVDFDVGSNVFNWQWVAGCGADAAPYFRIFNPTLQAKRFDPEGAYVRRWVPEIGTPDYPAPIIEHAEARERALAAYSAIKG
jgi:deoxyribodipyrimidine photo-lyase